MSLIKSAARRRLALFTGSSMAAAGIAAAASMAAVLAPTAANAQACAGTTVTGPQQNSVTCTGGDTVVTQTLGNQGTGALIVNLGSGNLIFNIDGTVTGLTSAPIPMRNGLTVTGAGDATVNVTRAYTNQIIGGARRANLFGAVNLSGLAGDFTLNLDEYGLFFVDTNSILSQGDSAININAGGMMYTTPTGSGGGGVVSNFSTPLTVDFNTGDNTLTNQGLLFVGPSTYGAGLLAFTAITTNKAELRLTNLDTFDNHSDIHLGVAIQQSNSSTDPAFADVPPEFGNGNWAIVFMPEAAINGTDRSADDMLTMPGATFVGHEGSRIFLDANLSDFSGAQDRCDATVRDSAGFLPAADCLNIQNGATEGVTSLVITDVTFGGRGAYNPVGVVIVDMSNGAGAAGSGAGGAAGQFVMDPSMRYYSSAYGGVLDNGMFMYQMYYDEELMQFRLIGVPSGGAHHQPLIVSGAQQAWRSANAGFFDRQADLRDTLDAGERRTSGAWARASYEKGERDAQQTFTFDLGDIAYDNKHDLNVSSLTVGADFLGSGDGDAYWVAGGLLGYVRTDIEYDDWTDAASMNGILLGGYGSLVAGPLFIDASVSGLWNRVDQTMPQAELFRDATLKTNINTLGAQAEAGWRFDLGMARIEPLVNASWVRTRARDYQVPEDDPVAPGNQIMFDDAVSTRAGVGLRGSTELVNPTGMRTTFSVTGRYSREFDGEASAAIGNLNPISPVVVDAFDGDFGEVTGGFAVVDSSGRLSGVLNVGTRFGDDYEAITASASFRYQW